MSVRFRTFQRRTLLLLLAFGLSMASLLAILLDTKPASAQLPPDFEDTLVARVSGGPTELAWTPDGRILVANKRGQVTVIENEQVVATPAIDLAPIMCTNGERALGGIAVHPSFETNGFVYLYYTFNKNGTCNESEIDGPVNRLSRFVMTGNIIDPASELVLMDTPPLFRDHHNAGDIYFANDGYLYVSVGDGGSSRFDWPQDPGRLLGKIVRLTDSGDIPPDNPFTGPGSVRCNVDGIAPPGSPTGAACQEIYALGLRNPWRIAFDPNAAGVRFFIGDVGQHSWEEINESAPGANYGWPFREGACLRDSQTDCPPPPPGITDPVYAYMHGPDGGAVTGGAFVPNGLWPAEYDGTYLFADYVFGQMYRLVPDPSNSFGYRHELFTDALRVVSMRFGPHGSLYYTSREDGHIRKITYTGDMNRAPVARATANPSSGPVPLEVQFDGSGSSDPDNDALTFSWDFEDDGQIDATGPQVTHTYSEPGEFHARLTVDDGRGGSNSTTVRVDAGNEPPVPIIESPLEGNLYAVGDTFVLSGSAIDPEDGALSDSSLVWVVDRHHADHTHPFLDATPGNNIPFTFPEPEDFHAAATSFLRVYLTATDSNGLSATVYRDLNPKFVDVTFLSDPPGQTLIVNESPITTPFTTASWEAYELRLNAPDQISPSGESWVFDSWSSGQPQSHTVITPTEPETYTAIFQPGTVSSTLTFTAIEDAQVRSAEPDRNFGSSSSIRTDGSPIINSYIKFELSGITGPVSAATLRIYPTSTNITGFDARAVTDSSWQESSITYENAPNMGDVAGSSGPTTAESWVDVDVTSLINGNGTLSIGMTSPSSTAANFASKERDGGNLAPQLIIQIGSGADEAPPSVPTGLSAVAISSSQVNLEWDPSTDNVGVTGYSIYRNGNELTSVDGTTLTFEDHSVNPGTTYIYSVDAFDAAGNRSTQSESVLVVTPGSGGATTQTFVAIEDAQVREESPAQNYGSSNSIRTDGEPIIRSYVKFDLSRIDGSVTQATLRIFATSNNTVGYRAFGVADSSWGESDITYNNAPSLSGDPAGSSGRVFAGTWTEVDVTSLVNGNGVLSLAIDSTSRTATNFTSRDFENGAFAPHLIVEVNGTGGDTTPPGIPTALSATAIGPNQVDLSWDASSDNVGVAGYTIFRDGSELTSVDGSTLVFSDTSATAGTTYSYAVEAFDAMGNRSGQSETVNVTTPGDGNPGSYTLTPVTDAQLREAEPDRNFGRSSSIRTDGSPLIHSYLTFDLSEVQGTIISARLRIFPTSSNTIGYQVHGVADTSWQEGEITWANAPELEQDVIDHSGRVFAGEWTEVDVTPWVVGDQTIGLAITSLSSTATNFASRETGGTSPQLILETGP